ncbi:MAG: hypothetical protein LBP52_08590, partial [Burkholderiaceae bacterium]|nr:hypothetical protein [Burkholderiaceae bacterium]
MATVYALSPKGQLECRASHSALPAQLQAMLRLIDGERTDTELLQAAGKSALTAGGLRWLAAAGYILATRTVNTSEPARPVVKTVKPAPAAPTRAAQPKPLAANATPATPARASAPPAVPGAAKVPNPAAATTLPALAAPQTATDALVAQKKTTLVNSGMAATPTQPEPVKPVAAAAPAPAQPVAKTAAPAFAAPTRVAQPKPPARVPADAPPPAQARLVLGNDGPDSLRAQAMGSHAQVHQTLKDFMLDTVRRRFGEGRYLHWEEIQRTKTLTELLPHLEP